MLAQYAQQVLKMCTVDQCRAQTAADTFVWMQAAQMTKLLWSGWSTRTR